MLLLGSSNTHLQAKLSYHYSIYVLSVRLIEALTSPFFSRIGPVQECISAEYERIHVLARNHTCTWRWRRAHARPSCIKLSGTSEQNESGRIRQLKFHCVSPSLSVCSSLFFTGKIETLLLWLHNDQARVTEEHLQAPTPNQISERQSHSSKGS
jgi:hypothetical protein